MNQRNIQLAKQKYHPDIRFSPQTQKSVGNKWGPPAKLALIILDPATPGEKGKQSRQGQEENDGPCQSWWKVSWPIAIMNTIPIPVSQICLEWSHQYAAAILFSIALYSFYLADRITAWDETWQEHKAFEGSTCLSLVVYMLKTNDHHSGY